MNRRRAEELAAVSVISQNVVRYNKKALGALRLNAMLQAKIIASSGTIEEKTWLAMCGISSKGLRTKRKLATPKQIERMALEATRFLEDEQRELSADWHRGFMRRTEIIEPVVVEQKAPANRSLRLLLNCVP